MRIQSLEFRCFQKILDIFYKDRITNELVRKTIIKYMGAYEDLLTTVKRRQLKLYGHVTRSDGLTSVHSDLMFSMIDMFVFLSIHDTHSTLLQHHNSKASILLLSCFLIVQVSAPYSTIGNTKRSLVSPSSPVLLLCPSILMLVLPLQLFP